MSDTSCDAKRVLCQIVQAAGGRLAGTVRLYKAFYFAHLYYWQRNDAPLTDHPIVRMPLGPGVHDGRRLLMELVADGALRASSQPVGPYAETVYEAARPFEVDPNDLGYQAVLEAVSLVEGRTASDLSELTHQYSRSWRLTADGDELPLYLDTLDDQQYDDLETRVNEARTLVESAFAAQR